MKRFLPCLLLVLVSVYACKTPEQKNREHVDSLVEAVKVSQMADSMGKDIMRNMYFDTVGAATGPVAILNAKFVAKEYSSSKDIALTWKNVTGKTISAIRFRWYGENAFGEPADMGSLGNGFGSGESDEEIRPGKTGRGTWAISSDNGKKIVKAWAYEVAFADGTKWESTYKK